MLLIIVVVRYCFGCKLLGYRDGIWCHWKSAVISWFWLPSVFWQCWFSVRKAFGL